MLRKQNRLQGFTLIEIIIALVIAGILAGAAIPLFSNLTQNVRATSAANNLYYLLQYARSEAIKQQANVYVSFTTGDNWCYGVNVGSACNCTVANNCGLATVSAPLQQQLSLSTTGLSGGSLYFEKLHGAANAAGESITFTVYGQTPLITLNIGRMGNPTMCSTGISGYLAC